MTTDPMLVFSREEYARRLEAVRGEMRERGADVVVVDEAEHLCYLTGFDRSATRYQACAVPLEGDPVMCLRSLDEQEHHLGPCIDASPRCGYGDYIIVP